MIIDHTQTGIPLEGIITFPEWVFVPKPQVPPNETTVLKGSSTGTTTTVFGASNLEE